MIYFTLVYLKLLHCPLLLYFYKIPLGGMGATKSLWTNNLILKYLTNLHLQTRPLEHKEFSGNSRNRCHTWKVSYSRLYNSWGGTLEKSISCFCSDKTAQLIPVLVNSFSCNVIQNFLSIALTKWQWWCKSIDVGNPVLWSESVAMQILLNLA